jgi:hypothetical protein
VSDVDQAISEATVVLLRAERDALSKALEVALRDRREALETLTLAQERGTKLHNELMSLKTLLRIVEVSTGSAPTPGNLKVSIKPGYCDGCGTHDVLVANMSGTDPYEATSRCRHCLLDAAAKIATAERIGAG